MLRKTLSHDFTKHKKSRQNYHHTRSHSELPQHKMNYDMTEWWNIPHDDGNYNTNSTRSAHNSFAMKNKWVEMQWRGKAAETHEINEECGGNKHKFNFLLKIASALFHYSGPFLLILCLIPLSVDRAISFANGTEADFFSI